AGCNGNDGTGSQIEVLSGFDDWDKLQFNARAALDFAGGAEPEKTSEQEQASFEADLDTDGASDPSVCGTDVLAPQFQPDALYPQPTHCAIDVKPGSNPSVLS